MEVQVSKRHRKTIEEDTDDSIAETSQEDAVRDIIDNALICAFRKSMKIQEYYSDSTSSERKEELRCSLKVRDIQPSSLVEYNYIISDNINISLEELLYDWTDLTPKSFFLIFGEQLRTLSFQDFCSMLAKIRAIEKKHECDMALHGKSERHWMIETVYWFAVMKYSDPKTSIKRCLLISSRYWEDGHYDDDDRTHSLNFAKHAEIRPLSQKAGQILFESTGIYVSPGTTLASNDDLLFLSMSM